MPSLTVVSVAYKLAPVGPDAVGGSEQVLTALDAALVHAGHRSIVVAMAGSRVAGELAAYPAAAGPITDAVVQRQRQYVEDTLRRVLAENTVDVVHMHGLDFHEYAIPPGPPVLATLHLPPSWYPPAAFEPARPNTWLSCVSVDQLSHTWPSRFMLPPIPNGVPVAELAATRVAKRGYALMLARICPEKGVHLALQAAHATGTSLLIGGEVFAYAAHQDYFVDQVLPLLDRHRRYLGPLSFARKRRLLAGASCLLIPSLAPETSSLVAMEAAACGTPVIAFRIGALPEIVEEGRTGFVVDDRAGLEAALARIDAIDPAICRQVATARFSRTRMTETYLARYASLAEARAERAA